MAWPLDNSISNWVEESKLTKVYYVILKVPLVEVRSEELFGKWNFSWSLQLCFTNGDNDIMYWKNYFQWKYNCLWNIIFTLSNIKNYWSILIWNGTLQPWVIVPDNEGHGLV